jgi:hypothetical protein
MMRRLLAPVPGSATKEALIDQLLPRGDRPLGAGSGLREAREGLERTTTEGISAERAVEWLETLSVTWRSAMPTAQHSRSAKVAVARPTAVGRALATYEIPIEGRDEWLAAARRLA